jgi:hypothetical protein
VLRLSALALLTVLQACHQAMLLSATLLHLQALVMICLVMKAMKAKARMFLLLPALPLLHPT